MKQNLDPATFYCPKDVSVYIHANRYLPKKTREALKEMIQCAIKSMKSLILLAVLLLALSACSSPLGRMERIWPDGASVKIVKFNLTVSMTGAGSVTADEVSWTGTNGFPTPGGTNGVGPLFTTPIPQGSVILSR